MLDVGSTEQPQTIISFCTGIRGLERGVERAFAKLGKPRPRVAVNVEIEAFAVANLVAGMEAGVLDPAPIWTDAKTFNAEPFRGRVCGIIGGYPCQGFSFAGKRKGKEDPRHLWPHILRHVDTIRPLWCFFENVRGHLSLGYNQVNQDLRAIGYHVECGIFTAEEVGAPHQRERLFILAILADPDKSGCGSLGGQAGRGDGITDVRQGDGQERTVRAGSAGELADTGFIGPQERKEQAAGAEQRSEFEPTAIGRSREDGREELGNSANINVEGDERRIAGRGQKQNRKPGGEMGDTGSAEPRGLSDVQREKSIEAGKPGKRKVVNTAKQGLQKPGQRRDGEFPEKNGGGMDDRFEQPGDDEIMGDTSFIGVQEPISEGQQIAATAVGRKISDSSGDRDKWPARPGEEQYDWEEPRVITRSSEPHVGLSIDGYNFREDLLRAIGNAVVEQTAEVAFLTLLKKHYE